MTRLPTAFATLLLVGAVLAVTPSRATACGCFSSPQLPTPDQYAVNQQAEQIIFEVDSEANTVTAQVLIQYAGAPESFAWILPVPTVPTLSLGEELSFALLDSLTSPQVAQRVTDACPQQRYACGYHPGCPSDAGVDASFDASAADSAPAPDAGDGPGVMVFGREVVGSYDVVVFSAGDTAAAVAWLNAEGFIVNDTMVPFMQPYADTGMIFVAAKLIPAADVDTLRPLTLTYGGTTPMIPLRLTAVGAEPELTVTTYIYGDLPFAPVDQAVVTLTDAELSSDRSGRSGYPMLLARTIDEAGGAAFVSEYRDISPSRDAIIGGASGAGAVCCVEGDPCGVADDGACQCPAEAWEAPDCGDGAVAAVDLLAGLAERNAVLTRLTTRLSAHEMTFDPTFAPGEAARHGRLRLTGSRSDLTRCTADVLDVPLFTELSQQVDCAATYCGSGACVITDAGAGCVCDAGFAARQFTDLDGQPSVTCVPEASPVDLSAGGGVLQSSCGGTDCGSGRCVDQGGFPACICDAGSAATVSDGAPFCTTTRFTSDDPGGLDRSAALASVPVCMMEPPTCEGGWLVRRSVRVAGEDCGRVPDGAAFVPPPPPDCSGAPDSGAGSDASADADADTDGGSGGGSGGCTVDHGSRHTWGPLTLFGLAVLAWRRRRRVAAGSSSPSVI